MMANLLNWFGGTKGELREALSAGAVAAGRAAAARPARSRSRVPASLPTAASNRSFAAEGASKVTVGPLDQCGVWSVVERARRPAASQNSEAAGSRSTKPGEHAEQRGSQA